MTRAPAEEGPSDWAILLGNLRSQWQTAQPLQHATVEPDWALAVASMQSQMHDLQRAGRWASGPHDLLSIVGLNRWELAHSAALAWLCTPHAAHGLGSQFLEGLLAETGEPVSLTGPIICRTEVSRSTSRADVIVEGAGWVLVIEVKVDAIEGEAQAERLYTDWRDDGDVRFVFLTQRSTPPKSAGPVAQAWVPLSWRWVRDLLQGLLERGEASAKARPALVEYVRTLEHTF